MPAPPAPIRTRAAGSVLLAALWLLAFSSAFAQRGGFQPLSRSRDYPPMVQAPLRTAHLARTADGRLGVGAGSVLIAPTGGRETRVLFPAELTALGATGGLLLAACRGSFGYVEQPDLERLRYRPLRNGAAAVERIITHGDKVYFYGPQTVYIYLQTSNGSDTTAPLRETGVMNAEGGAFRGVFQTSAGVYVLQANGAWLSLAGPQPPPAVDWAADEKLVAQAENGQGGNLLLTSHGRLFRWKASGKFEALGSLTESELGGKPEPTGLVAWNNRWIVATREHGCLILEDKDGRPLANARPFRPSNRENTVLAMLCDSDGRLWMAHDATWSWTYLNLPVRDFGTYSERLRGRVNKLTPSSRGVYIATDGGLLSNRSDEHQPSRLMEQYMSLKKQFVLKNYPLYDASFREILELTQRLTAAKARETNEKSKRENRRQAHIERMERQLAEKRREFAKMERELELIWKTQRPAGTPSPDQNGPAFGYVAGLEGVACRDLLDTKSGLLAATEAGVFALRGGRAERLGDPRLRSCTRLAAPADQPDRAFVVCEGRRLHALRRRGERWEYETEIEWLLPHEITTLAAESGKRLWLGTTQGVFVLDFQGPNDALPKVSPVKLPEAGEEAPRVYVRFMLGKLHALTEDRVLIYDGNAFSDVTTSYRRQTEDKNLIAEILNAPVAADSAGLWWLRNGGLTRLHQHESGGKPSRSSYDLLALTGGAKALSLEGNKLWLATDGQVFRVDTEQLAERSLEKKSFACLLRSVRILDAGGWGAGLQDSVLDLRQTLSLPYAGFYRVHFDFEVNTFDAPDRIVFQLLTRGDEWTNLVSNQEVLTLTWGYGMQRIVVRAVDAFGNTSEPVTLEYWIEPPIWFRWYALALYALAAVGLGWLLVRWIEKRAESRAQARNAALERLVMERTATIEAQKDEMEALIRQLGDKNAELEMQQTVIQQVNAELEAANRELIDSREQMVQTEKMAALGEITPAIAHEINSPLGAISNTIHNMGASLPQLLDALPARMQALRPETAERLRQLTPKLVSQPVQLSARDERRASRSLSQTLDDLNLPSAEDWADRIVKAGLHEHIDTLTPVLVGPDAEAALSLLEQIAGAGRQLLIMRRSIERAIHIVRALKDYVHRRADSQNPVLFDLTENIDLVLTLYEYHIKKGIELVQEYEDLPLVMGFPEELSQVWTNLIMNAVYALNLRIRAAQQQGEAYHAMLKIELARENGHAVVRLTDNGPGIPEAIQTRIFEALFTTKPKGEGTGLGLSICRKIVEKHGGQLGLESRAGHTQFTVRLPIAGPPVKADAEEA